jgi:PQQ-like domain
LKGISQPPTAISYGFGAPNVPGAVNRADLMGASLVYVGSRLIKYNPLTGAATLNISLPISSGTIYCDPYVLSMQTIGSGSSAQYRLINWSMAGTSTNFPDRIISNISYPFSSIGVADYETGIAVFANDITNPGTGADYGSRIMGANLVTGQLLWNITTTDTPFSGSTAVADHGMYATAMMNNYWDAFDLQTGKQVWKSDVLPYPWGWAWSYEAESVYGMLYSQSYAGLVAFDWKTGHVVWTFVAPAPPFKTPYTTNGTNEYAFEGAEIADGKIYAFTCEHSPSAPLTIGWRLYCINATSGTGIWNITGDLSPGAIQTATLQLETFMTGTCMSSVKDKAQLQFQHRKQPSPLEQVLS